MSVNMHAPCSPAPSVAPEGVPEVPFLIVRQMSSFDKQPARALEIIGDIARHRGCCDEIWLASPVTFDAAEAVAAMRDSVKLFRGRIEKAGIQFSLQRGLTLGHGPSDSALFARFSDDAFLRTPGGGTVRGCFCTRSPEFRDSFAALVTLDLGIYRPASYWLDDDFRIGCGKQYGCYCNRCMRAFAKFTGLNLGPEELAGLLVAPERQAVRSQWIAFQGESLREIAAMVRKIADRESPETRLGIQTTFAECGYTGFTSDPVLGGLSDGGRKPVGIRPGAGYYSDEDPRGMLLKALQTALEAERCRGMPYVSQVCTEIENYAHADAIKTVRGEMVECALDLASGADSLALYRHDVANMPAGDDYPRFAEACARWRPYFQRLADVTRRTSLCGLVAPWPARAFETPDVWDGKGRGPALWFEAALMNLQFNGVPVSVPGGDSRLTLLSAFTARHAAAEELDKLLAGAVLADGDALAALLARADVRLPEVGIGGGGHVLLNDAPHELFADGGMFQAGAFAGALRHLVLGASVADDPETRIFSRLNGGEPLSAVLRTPQGGRLGASLYCGFPRHPSLSKRRAVLDMIDALTGGGFPVRSRTDRTLVLAARSDAGGRIACVTLLNPRIEATPGIVVDVRRPADGAPLWMSGEAGTCRPAAAAAPDGSTRFTLPALAPWGIATLFL